MRVFLGITGASGAPYAKRLVEALAAADCELGVCASAAARSRCSRSSSTATRASRGTRCSPGSPTGTAVPVTVSDPNDCALAVRLRLGEGRRLRGLPGSMGTRRRARGRPRWHNLIHRAASVALEGRPQARALPRETPLSTIHLESLLPLRQAGATILFARAGLLRRGRVESTTSSTSSSRACLDQLGLDNALARRWGA